MGGATSLWSRDTQLYTLLPVSFLQKLFKLLHCCCPLHIPEEKRELPAGTKMTYNQQWPSGEMRRSRAS